MGEGLRVSPAPAESPTSGSVQPLGQGYMESLHSVLSGIFRVAEEAQGHHGSVDVHGEAGCAGLRHRLLGTSAAVAPH